MILKFNLKKLAKLAAVGAASLALIVPLSMNSGTVANAAEGPYYDANLDDLVYNGYCNEDGYWIGSKHDKWLYDNGLLEPIGIYSDEYDTVKNYSKTRHISFIHALNIYNAAQKMPQKYLDGKDVESAADEMDIYEEMHHKHLNRPSHHISNHHAIKRHSKRTPRKPHKKNVRRPKARRDKRTAAKKQPKRTKHSKRRGKRTIKARRPRKTQKKHKSRRIRR